MVGGGEEASEGGLSRGEVEWTMNGERIRGPFKVAKARLAGLL